MNLFKFKNYNNEIISKGFDNGFVAMGIFIYLEKSGTINKIKDLIFCKV